MGLVIEKERKKRQEDCGVFQTSTWASECPATTCYYVHNILSLKIKKKKMKGWKQKVYQKLSNRSNQSPRFQNLGVWTRESCPLASTDLHTQKDKPFKRGC